MGRANLKSQEKVMTRINECVKDKVSDMLWAITIMLASMSAATATTIESIDYTIQSANKVQIMLTLSDPAPKANSFTIDNPARLAVDFPGVSLGLDNKNIRVDSALVRNIRAVEAGERSRLVISMVKVVPYEIRTENNQVYISISEEESVAEVIAGQKVATASIENIDFQRGADGSAVVQVDMTDENASISTEQKADKIIVDFYNFSLPEELRRRLDVADFATPATFVDFYTTESGARMAISAEGIYEHLAYQAGKQYTVELKPLSEEEAKDARKDKLGYSGEKLSLNFQSIEVRAVLQLIADFTSLNIVASDSVTGSITLRLKNVPWDQALDIILKTRGLGMRKSGNVVLVAPNEELAAREKQELEAQKQMVDLSPLHTEFYAINYAKAADIAALLKADKNSILTSRGSVTIDARTNTLMVLESPEKHDEVARLISRLDVPVRQVMIESRIVIANDDFSKDIGVRTGVTHIWDNDSGDGITALTGTAAGSDVMTASVIDNLGTTGSQYPVEMPPAGSRYNVNFPAPGAPSIALGILGADYLIDLELSALQTEGRGEVISNPRVVTSNQKEAVIEQGVEIPYQEASSSGATSVSFKKAVLSLAVTPQITPDERVVMDLEVNKDSVGGIYAGVPSINTRSVQTQVLVDNGDTVVLGGIYETTSARGESKVPLLGDIPLLGYLFRSSTDTETKAELLVFVTPKILREGLSAAVE